MFREVRNVGHTIKLILTFSGLSISIISAAFVLTNFANGLGSSRFLVNIFYLFIVSMVTFGALRWHSGNYPIKFFLLIALLGYITLGLSSIAHLGWRYSTNWTDTRSLANWLIRKKLHYGYGQYFDANAPLLSIVSKDKVIARPLSCNMGYLIPRLSSGDDQFWFDKANLPKKQEPQFVVFSRSAHDWERCAVRSFGNPSIKLNNGTLSIWIYRHNLSHKLTISYKEFKQKWTSMNIARNRKAITNVGETIGINSEWAQNVYTWILKNRIAD